MKGEPYRGYVASLLRALRDADVNIAAFGRRCDISKQRLRVFMETEAIGESDLPIIERTAKDIIRTLLAQVKMPLKLLPKDDESFMAMAAECLERGDRAGAEGYLGMQDALGDIMYAAHAPPEKQFHGLYANPQYVLPLTAEDITAHRAAFKAAAKPKRKPAPAPKPRAKAKPKTDPEPSRRRPRKKRTDTIENS